MLRTRRRRIRHKQRLPRPRHQQHRLRIDRDRLHIPCRVRLPQRDLPASFPHHPKMLTPRGSIVMRAATQIAHRAERAASIFAHRAANVRIAGPRHPHRPTIPAHREFRAVHRTALEMPVVMARHRAAHRPIRIDSRHADFLYVARAGSIRHPQPARIIKRHIRRATDARAGQVAVDCNGGRERLATVARKRHMQRRRQFIIPAAHHRRVVPGHRDFPRATVGHRHRVGVARRVGIARRHHRPRRPAVRAAHRADLPPTGPGHHQRSIGQHGDERIALASDRGRQIASGNAPRLRPLIARRLRRCHIKQVRHSPGRLPLGLGAVHDVNAPITRRGGIPQVSRIREVNDRRRFTAFECRRRFDRDGRGGCESPHTAPRNAPRHNG